MIQHNEIVKADESHAHAMAPFMRLPDVAEVWASSHLTPLEALIQSLRVSDNSWAWVRDGRTLCMFGVAAQSPMSIYGSPWMLTTNEVIKNRVIFIRHCKEVVGKMIEAHPILVGMVDDRNAAAKHWLEWLGFTLGQPEVFGASRLMFRKFMMVR